MCKVLSTLSSIQAKKMPNDFLGLPLHDWKKKGKAVACSYCGRKK